MGQVSKVINKSRLLIDLIDILRTYKQIKTHRHREVRLSIEGGPKQFAVEEGAKFESGPKI